MKALVPLYDDDKLAFKQALEQVQLRWKPDTFGTSNPWMPDDSKLMKDGPSNVWADQAPPKKLQPALTRDYDEMFEQEGLDKTEFEIMDGVKLPTGKTIFYIRKRGEYLPYSSEDGGNIAWSFNYADSTEAKLEALDVKYKQQEAETVMANETIDTMDDMNRPGIARAKRSVGSGIATAADTIGDTLSSIADIPIVSAAV